MIKELWLSFPKLLEQKINALLDTAEPNPVKSFQLFKTCEREGLWNDSFENFSKNLTTFFAQSRVHRKKSDFDAFLDRPMSSTVYEHFHLDFRNSLIDNRALLTIASWSHHLMRVSLKTESVIISSDVLTKTLHYITNPPLFEKAQNIEFSDFCTAWKKTVFKIFGKKYDSELENILKELKWLETQSKLADENDHRRPFTPSIYLTQTEIDWTVAVREAALENQEIPKFPLSKGPSKPRLIDLERTIKLYRIVQSSQLPEFIQHRNRIRLTILDRCESLLRERAS